jgi:hypothetical protein
LGRALGICDHRSDIPKTTNPKLGSAPFAENNKFIFSVQNRRRVVPVHRPEQNFTI